MAATGFGYASTDSSKWSMAWALHAGVAYNVTNNFKVELAYRYVNFGSIDTPVIDCAFVGLRDRRPARLLLLHQLLHAGHQDRHALDAAAGTGLRSAADHPQGLIVKRTGAKSSGAGHVPRRFSFVPSVLRQRANANSAGAEKIRNTRAPATTAGRQTNRSLRLYRIP